MKVQSTLYPGIISKTVDLLLNQLIYNQKMTKLLIFDASTLLIREKKLSQITHFCDVKLLAWKSGCVKFWTNIISLHCRYSYFIMQHWLAISRFFVGICLNSNCFPHPLPAIVFAVHWKSSQPLMVQRWVSKSARTKQITQPIYKILHFHFSLYCWSIEHVQRRI